MRDEDVKPDWRWIALDETAYWDGDPEFAAKCGKIFGIYIFDASLRVYCCEMTPSYELYFLRSEPLRVPEDDAEREALDEVIREGDTDTDPVSYIHCRTIDAKRWPRLGWDDELCGYEGPDKRDSRAQADDVLAFASECQATGAEPDLLAVAMQD